MIQLLKGDLKRLARVVYCQRLPDGHVAVGLQFQGNAVKWADESVSGTVLATVLTIFFTRFVFWRPATLFRLLPMSAGKRC